jgi:hypothetical protein
MQLRNPLTTKGLGIGNLATMRKAKPKPSRAALAMIYAKRQPKRPHYLAEIMEWKDVDRAALIEDLGVDKSTLSRWLDEENPTTPGTEWAEKLGRYFASGPEDDDFVDIFTDPAVSRFRRLTVGRSDEEIDRMLATLEAAFPAHKARTGT